MICEEEDKEKEEEWQMMTNEWRTIIELVIIVTHTLAVCSFPPILDVGWSRIAKVPWSLQSRPVLQQLCFADLEHHGGSLEMLKYVGTWATWYYLMILDDVDDNWCYLMISDDIWWYLMILDDSWWYLMIRDDIWCYLMIFDDMCWYLIISDDIWWYLMIHDDVWWCFMIFDDIWWYVMISDDIWC